MKAFVKDQQGLSRSQTRVANALAFYAPDSVEIVKRADDAEVVVLHVIGYPETETEIRRLISRGQNYAMIQYCLRTTQKPDTVDWLMFWQMAECVWSYYDLEAELCLDYGVTVDDWHFPFYHAPLGVDPVFARSRLNGAARDIGIMTSGFVTGFCGEAIEEVATAAKQVDMTVMHIGPPNVELIVPPHKLVMPHPGPHWRSEFAISDAELRDLYIRSKWVSGLRHVEGFELPALEGLVCGARPILFDRPEMRRWYGDHAEFVPECHGGDLVDQLDSVLSGNPKPVTEAERQDVIAKFDWQPLVERFWEIAGA